MALFRGLVLILILALVLLVLGRKLALPKQDRGRIIILGLCSGIIGTAYLSALSFVPVAVAVTTFYTFPLLLILIAPFTGSGRITMGRVFAFLLAFTGIVICVGPSMGGLDWRGVWLAFMASVACALMFELMAKMKGDRLELMFWSQLIALVIVVPVALVLGPPKPAVIISAGLALVISALGFYLGFAGQVIASVHVRAATSGLLFLLEPVVAILAATVILRETLSTFQIAGIVCVIAGLALDVWTQSRSKPT
jgi:drug/metabolite transporter (DMT)-like permease